MNGLFVGRFQPFHNGHLFSIKKILKECESVIVLIGSAEKSFTLENPFTCGERYGMMFGTLKAEGLVDRCMIVPVSDTRKHSHAIWSAKVRNNCPAFGVVYSNNPLVKLLFEREGVQVKGTELIARDELNATRLRERMLEGTEWKKFVPDQVFDYITRNKLIERLRSLSSSK